jgi:hypothetical protein
MWWFSIDWILLKGRQFLSLKIFLILLQSEGVADKNYIAIFGFFHKFVIVAPVFYVPSFQI